MSDFFDRIADEWRQRAPELAQWTLLRMVNRTDVWGHYLPLKHRKPSVAGGPQNNAVTAPFRDERGKVFLGISSLEKHYKTRKPGGVLGVHSIARDNSSRWMAIDIDLHDAEDLSVTAEGNFVAARGWWQRLHELGLDPVLMDSNGAGGFHILVLFAEPMGTKSVLAFSTQLVADFMMRGLDRAPEVFPSSQRARHYGSWLRLPGRHHTRIHYTRVFNDEPTDDREWLDGHEAIDRLMSARAAVPEILAPLGILPVRKVVCIDFDGVLHSYVSGWCGEDVIPDPPIHRTREAVLRLRKSFEVVVHSARCRSQEGREAIRRWLAKHEIEVDEVCEHKPPAFVYLDDRGVPFQGDWDQAIAAIHDFRK